MKDFLCGTNSKNRQAACRHAQHLKRTCTGVVYDSETSRMLHDEKYGLHLMSDTYIINDLIAELRNKQ